MSRALRKHHEERLRKKRFKQLKQWRDDVLHKNDPIVGKTLQTPKDCSNYCCGNPRKYFNEKTIQERKAEQEY